jgi:hypothetical protein
MSGDLKLLIIQKLLEDRRLAKERFSAQFSRVEKLLQQYRYKQPPIHTVARKVLRPVLKSGEALATVQVQHNHQHTLWQEKFSAQFSRMEKVLQQYRYKQPPTHTMASRVLRPGLQRGEALAPVQIQTTTNTHYGK